MVRPRLALGRCPIVLAASQCVRSLIDIAGMYFDRHHHTTIAVTDVLSRQHEQLPLIVEARQSRE